MTTADFERLQHRFVRYHTAPRKLLAPWDYVHRLYELHRLAKG